MITILFAKTTDKAIIPSKRTEDLGYDIYACFEEEEFEIPPFTTKMIPTGIASVIPSGWGILLEERGSTGSIGMKRSAGVIESNYRGEWFVALTNTNSYPIVISKNVKEKVLENQDGVACYRLLYPYTKAIVQAILIPRPDSEVKEISFDELKGYTSDRGAGKLGSTGK